MSQAGLPIMDESNQTTHIWLNEIGDVIGPDRQRCYHALRAVLHALRDRLTVDEAAHLAAQLPTFIRGVFYESYRPSDTPLRVRSVEDFIALVNSGLRNIAPIDAVDATRAVFWTLARHITPGEIDDVKQMLPEEIRRLFPDVAPPPQATRPRPEARR
jgi:uncharacterized protein (DUF2267 family)